MKEREFKLTLEEVRSDPTVQRMLSRRSLSEETAESYVKGVRFFCEFFGQKPFEVLERLRGRSIDDLIDVFGEFFTWAKDRVAPKTAWDWLAGIRAWLVENGVREVDRAGREIARELRRKLGPAKPLLKRDLLSKEEITRLLKVAGLREKAIIAVMASGGFRLRTALRLQVKHLKDDIMEGGKPCYAVEVPEELNKEREPYITFISEEAAEYVRAYLLMRKGKGEPITPDTYLFVAEERRGEQVETRPLSPRRFQNIWRELCKKAGLDMRPVPIKGVHKVGGGKKVNHNAVRYNTRIHALRKFFKTACSTCGVDRMASEAFLGHSLAAFGVEKIYDYCVMNFDWLRSEYMKVLPAVTFLKELKVLPVRNHEAHEKIKALEGENRALKERLKELEADIQELKSMLSRLLK